MPRTRNHARAVLAAVFLCLALAVPPARAASPAGSPTPDIEWSFATLAPKRVGWARQFERIVLPFFQENTDGGVRLKVYWGGVMGDDAECIRKMDEHMVDGAGLSGRGANLLLPQISVLQLPFLFRNYEEVDYIKEKMTGRFEELLAARGVFLAGWIDQDFDQVYSISRPYAGLDDFAGARIHTWFGPVEEELIRALGAVPVPMSVPDSLPAARRGEYDVGMGPALWWVGSQLYGVFRYVNPMPIRYSPALMVIRMDVFETIPTDWQHRIRENRAAMSRKFSMAIREDNAEALEAMVQYGMVRVNSTAPQLAQLRQATLPIRDRLAGSLYPESLLAELLAHLEAYRSGPGR